MAADESGGVVGGAWIDIRINTADYKPVGYLYDIKVKEWARV